jgi:hypothetical protein
MILYWRAHGRNQNGPASGTGSELFQSISHCIEFNIKFE